MPRFRIITVPSGKAHSEWRPTLDEAVEDAIRLELADRDWGDAAVHWNPLAAIEEEDDDEGALAIINPRTGERI